MNMPYRTPMGSPMTPNIDPGMYLEMQNQYDVASGGYRPPRIPGNRPPMMPGEIPLPGQPGGGPIRPPAFPPTNIPTYPESAPLGGGGVGNYPMGPTNPLPVPGSRNRGTRIPGGPLKKSPLEAPNFPDGNSWPPVEGSPPVPNPTGGGRPPWAPRGGQWPPTLKPDPLQGTGGGMGFRSGAGGGSRGMSLLPPPPPKPSGGGGSPPAPTGGGGKWNEQIPGMPGGGYGGMGPDSFGDRYRRRQNLPGGGVTGGIPMGSGGNQISPFNPNAALPSQKSVMAPRPNSANNNRFSTGGNMIANRMKGGYRGAQGGGGYSGQVSGRYQTPSGGMNSFDTGGLNANPGGTYSPMSPGMPQPGRPSPQPRAPRQPRYPSFADPNMGWGGSLRRSPAMTFNQGNTNINNQLTQQGPRIARNMGRMGGYNPMMFGGQSRQIGGLRNLMQMLAAMRGGRR